MADDFDVFDFALTDDEMARIASLENGASAFFDHRTADSAARFDSMRQG